ncbi:MAG: DUF3572 domain-containing protein [Rhodobacteraceae bacterium]|nr:DUF3572 domain-containing protein [Paracoccaceae bacterium]
MKQEQAEVVALHVLGWLVGNDELNQAFLGASGMSVADLKTRAGEPEFLASVLEFLMLDDRNVIAFCDAHGLAYETPMQALYGLPGQAVPNWT